MSEKKQNNISINFSELFPEIIQKEMNNNESTFTITKIYDKSNKLDNSSRFIINKSLNIINISENKILNTLNNNESKNIQRPSFNEQINNKENEIIPENEIIQENEIKNSHSKEDDCSDLIHEVTQKEINNNKTFTGTKIYDKSNEIDNSGK